MPIIGVTHDRDGKARISRSVTTKVAIGLAPTGNSNFPKRLDHFALLKKVQVGTSEIRWEIDQDLTRHYGDNCREIWIVFLDDEIDSVFRTEYAAYVKRGKWCAGDGNSAQRRDLGRDGKQWSEMKPYKGPCAEGGCPNLHDEKNAMPCAPSGDLYFMLADFPTLGSICRIHTSSYQSIRQIYSALQDLRRITGGRLMGVTAKLFVHPDKNVYEQGGATKTGTKWVLGLELRAADMAGMQTKMLETARVFNQIKGELSGQVLDIEDDEERGPEIAAEFYPAASVRPAESGVVLSDPEQKLREEAIERMTAAGLNTAQRQAKLGQYQGRLPELIDNIKRTTGGANAQVSTASPQKSAAAAETAPNAAPVRAAEQAANGIPHDDQAEPVVTEGPRGGSEHSANRNTPEAQGPVTPSSSGARRTQSADEKGPRESAAQASGAITDDDLPANMRGGQPAKQQSGFDF